jgi:FMN phosphatase YigB (HAD superfamily)
MNGGGDEGIQRLKAYLEYSANGAPQGLAERLQSAVLRREALRLVEVLDRLALGELRGLALGDAWDVLQIVRESTTVNETACILRCDELRRVDDALANTSISMLLGWLDRSTRLMPGSIVLEFESETGLVTDPEYLNLALCARRAGWRVAVGASTADSPLVLIQLGTETDGTVGLSATRASNVGATTTVIRFASEPVAELPKMTGLQEVYVPDAGPMEAPDENDVGVSDESLTVSDLFGDLIVLRDLEPRAAALHGISVFRAELGWDPVYIPRKNEPNYARVLMRIMEEMTADGPDQIVYVGDTLLNDGGAIRGLQRVGPPGGVWGFLCGATRGSHDDFVVGSVYYGARWSSLAPFLGRATEEGLALGERTYVLFDLDQTVYAAKGRDDEPLLRARWDAARAYLEEIVPAYKFDPSRAEALYREFDDDAYHPVTRDNLDYVILLVLAVASGLADASEIRNYSNSSGPSIEALADELHRRASARVGHEEIVAVLDAIQAIYYNTLAGDQTPCKDFRRFECLAMARRMRGEDLTHKHTDERIFLNREVTDVIEFLRSTGATLMAVSDRPTEAAIVEGEGGAAGETTDLMHVPMAIRGVSLADALNRWRTHSPKFTEEI